MQRNILALGLVTGLALFAFSVRPSVAGPCGAHPHFDDQGTLTWYTTLDEAVAAARASGKYVFVEFGRRECRNCRVLVEKILPCPELRARISVACVGLAADCDEADPRVEALFRTGLPCATTLPFCGFATPDMRWVTGFSGLVGADECMRQMDAVETARARDAAASRPACPSRSPIAAPAATALPVAPTAPLTSAAPARAELEKARALLDRARQAAATSHYGEVVRLDGEAAKMTLRVDPAGWTALLTQADGWSTRALDGAAAAARQRRWDDAQKLLAEVRLEMAGLKAGREALAGERALAGARGLDALAAAERPKARATGLQEFQGTRWADLFRG